jgi:oligopeptide transport system ATP-binding protein
MYGGRTMEYGSVQQVFHNPQHPYAIGLLAALPRVGGEEISLRTIPGNPPNMLNLPSGCPFNERCPESSERCFSDVPGIEAGHTVARHKREEAV